MYDYDRVRALIPLWLHDQVAFGGFEMDVYRSTMIYDAVVLGLYSKGVGRYGDVFSITQLLKNPIAAPLRDDTLRKIVGEMQGWILRKVQDDLLSLYP